MWAVIALAAALTVATVYALACTAWSVYKTKIIVNVGIVPWALAHQDDHVLVCSQFGKTWALSRANYGEQRFATLVQQLFVKRIPEDDWNNQRAWTKAKDLASRMQPPPEAIMMPTKLTIPNATCYVCDIWGILQVSDY